MENTLETAKNTGEEQDNQEFGYYHVQTGALYSKDPEQVAKKQKEIKEKHGENIKLIFKGDFQKELSKCIENTKNKEKLEEGVKGIKRVLSFSLMELLESFDNEQDLKKNICQTKKLIEQLLEEYKESFLLLFTKEHSPSTIIHSINVMALALYVYQYVKDQFKDDLFLKESFLEMGNVEEFALAGLLHDMGKIFIKEVVEKKEKLTEDDWQKIKAHPEKGYQLLKNAGLSEKILNVILYHHRRIDGTGYPKIKEGDEVMGLTHFFAIIDSLVSMSSFTKTENENKKPITMQEAEEKIFQEMKESKKITYSVELLNLVKNALEAGKNQKS